MKAASGTVVSIHYTLTDDAGVTLYSSHGHVPFNYLHGHGALLGALEDALEGAEPGFQSQIMLTPEEGYGERDEHAVFEVPRDRFPDHEDIAVGMQVQGEGPQGLAAFTVVGLSDTEVILDGNHPLAGRTLHFDIEILEVRKATAQELEHGHVHDEDEDH